VARSEMPLFSPSIYVSSTAQDFQDYYRKKFGDRAKTTHQVVANVAQTGPKTSSMH